MPTERQIIKDLRKDRDAEKTARQIENGARREERKAETALLRAEKASKTKFREALDSILIACNGLSLREARTECKRIAEDALQ